MHEYSIVQSLVDSVAASTPAGATVHRIEVRIGEVAGVDCALLATAFEVFRAGTLCERAEMSIRRVPARWVCSSCNAALERGRVLRCHLCGAAARLAEGDEIILQQIELEVA